MHVESPARPRPATTAGVDPLDVLTAIDHLEVGPVESKRKELCAPYRVRCGGSEETRKLRFRFEEEVLEPGDPVARNLAAMVAAQAAVNYGLFCRRISFVGVYDDEDQKFLRVMLSRTAREIYVKRFLESGPAFTEDVLRLPALQRLDYGRAEVSFRPWGSALMKLLECDWHCEVDRRRYAVVSDGGSHSLLSHGLLAEIGYESHPIFVVESGLRRSAAQRHFEDEIAHSTRVTTNAGRIFSWLSSHLPFLRAQPKRAARGVDAIALWTLPVALFAILPVLRRRGIGRLVVGNGYRTTMRASHQGIAHYGGLYCRSRWFDRTMNRYFRAKGWALTQLSLLRPLSEPLVERILAERYPWLDRLLLKKGGIAEGAQEVPETGDPVEVLSPRFDPEQSPIEAIPAPLRRLLVEIWSDHSPRILRRGDRSQWVDLELDDEEVPPGYARLATPGQGSQEW